MSSGFSILSSSSSSSRQATSAVLDRFVANLRHQFVNGVHCDLVVRCSIVDSADEPDTTPNDKTRDDDGQPLAKRTRKGIKQQQQQHQ